MKALIVNGSPRGKKSNSSIMTGFFEQGMVAAGVETETVYLSEKNLEFCRGCLHCIKGEAGKCIIDDGLNLLLDKYSAADYVVFAAPVYYYTMPAILKNFIDRLLPLVTYHVLKNGDGAYYHKNRQVKQPKVVLLTNCGFPGEGNFGGIKVAFTFLDPTAIICRNQGELLKIGESPAREMVAGYGELLKKAGREIVETGSLPADLDRELTESFMPDDAYAEAINLGILPI